MSILTIPYARIGGAAIDPIKADTLLARWNLMALRVWGSRSALGRMLKKPASKAAASEAPRRTLWGTLRV